MEKQSIKESRGIFRQAAMCCVLLFVSFIPCPVSGEETGQAQGDNFEARIAALVNALCHEDYDTAGKVGEEFRQDTHRGWSEVEDMWWHIALGTLDLAEGKQVDAYDHLSQARMMAGTANDVLAMSLVNNTFGLYYQDVLTDNMGAQRYFFMAWNDARKLDNSLLQGVILCNLSHACFLLGDRQEALAHAHEAYALSERMDDDFVKCRAAMEIAECNLNGKDYDKALEYVGVSERLSAGLKADMQERIYVIHARVLQSMRHYEEAATCYEKALASSAEAHRKNAEALTGYAMLKYELGERQEAIAMLEQAVGDTSRVQSFSDVRLLIPLSDFYRRQGRYDKAYELSLCYITKSDSILNESREKMMAEMRARFEVEQAESLVKRQREQLYAKQNLINMQVAIIVLVVVGAVIILVMYRHRMKLYNIIVAQTQEQLRAEQKSALPTDGEDEKKSNSAGPSSELASRLIEKIDRAMGEERAYTDPFITKEKLAMQLGANRTYLSQIINTHYDMSFTQLVNSFRVKEAIRLLSDPSCRMTIREMGASLGFNSVATFNSHFKDAIGLTPGSYRKQLAGMKTHKEAEELD